MKAMIVSMLVAVGLMTAGMAVASDMPGLAMKYGCKNCHKIDKKAMGPAWQDVANKYKGDAGAAVNLNNVIMKGGKGVWGRVPMPATKKISEPEANELVSFILGLAK